MKNTIKNSLFSCIALFAFAIPFNSFAGWDYKSQESIDRMDGRTYIVSHCENKIGDDCTTPGSATRMDISAVTETLQAGGIIYRIP